MLLGGTTVVAPILILKVFSVQIVNAKVVPICIQEMEESCCARVPTKPRTQLLRCTFDFEDASFYISVGSFKSGTYI